MPGCLLCASRKEKYEQKAFKYKSIAENSAMLLLLIWFLFCGFHVKQIIYTALFAVLLLYP